MNDWYENLRTLFREYPRMWVVSAVAVFVGVFAVWVIYAGFSFEIGRFFAAAPPSFVINSVTPLKHGEKLSVSWSATNSLRCDPMGWFETGGAKEGTAESNPINACAATTVNSVGVDCLYSGNDHGVKTLTFTIDTTTCPSTAKHLKCVSNACALVDGAGANEDGCATAGATCGGGGGDPACGPTIPNGGRLDWSFRTSEPWDECAEGVSNATAAQFWTEANVTACHPDEGFHLVWRAQHRPKATCAMKDVPVDVEYSEGQGIVTDNGNFDENNNLAPDTAGKARMTYTTSTTDCGSVHMFGAFWADDAQNPETYKHNNAGNAGYHKIINYGKDCGAATPVPTATASPSATPVPTATASPSATPTTSPTPTVSVIPIEEVACAPVIQTVQVNQTARLEASGGDGAYKWTIIQGGKLKEGGNQYIGVSYSVVGSKTLRVDSAGLHAICAVDVVDDADETPTEALVVQKTGRNTTSGEPSDSSAITVYPGQTAQFRVRVVNNASSAINQVKLTDIVPAGMSYIRGSTRVEDQAIAADSVTTSGLSVGRLETGETVTVQWSAVADRTSTISGGPNRSSPAVRVSGSGISDVTAEMAVTVYGSGASGAGGVPTGPGDAVLAALLTAAVLTLLYSGYTRSGLYRRREAEAMSHDQGPLDFRS